MIIKVKKDFKDRETLQRPHPTVSRRDFLSRGVFTTTMAATLPHALLSTMAKSAYGATTSCASPATAPGGIAHINGSDGGFSIGAYLLSAQQLEIASAGSNAANLYGVTGSNNAAIFANGGVAADSPFGATLMTPPPGISAASWTAALKQVSIGGNLGASPNDDGAGDNQGQWGAISPYKPSGTNTDIIINPAVSLASWAQGLGTQLKVKADPSTNNGAPNLTPALLAAGFGITPPGVTASATNATTLPIFTAAANAGTQLGQLFNSILGGSRSGAQTSLNAASCGFLGDSVMASTTYGLNLFTPSSITPITSSGIQLTGTGAISVQEQALLAAYYQSTVGQVGGIMLDNPGADYHGQSVQNTISPYDSNVALQIRMWLLAAMIAQQPSVLMLTTNGQAGCNGATAATINVPGAAATLNVMGPSAQGDEGGAYSAHWIMAYAPNGKTPPNLAVTGTIASASGRATVDSRFSSVPASTAALYYTALQYLGFNTTGFASVLSAHGFNAVSLIS